MVKLYFSASDGMYESELADRSQPPNLELGPFEDVTFTYHTVLVGGAGEQVAHYDSANGVWSVPSHNASFSDITIMAVG